MTTKGQVRNAYPAMRVFIFGVEITDDILSCTLTYQDGRAANTAEFVLANKGKNIDGAGVEDRYIVTETDIHALYDSVNINTIQLPELGPAVPFTLADTSFDFGAGIRNAYIRNATEGPQNEIDAAVRARVQRDVADVVKARVLKTKVTERVPGITQPDVSQIGTDVSSIPRLAALRGDALTFPLQVGDCIFHSNDPVRIFWRDPFDTKTWYHMFSGYMTDSTDSVTADNERTVILRCEDVSRILRYARITTNPGIFDVDKVAQDEDAVVRTFFNEGFSELTLTEFLYTIIFGSETVGLTTAQLGADNKLQGTRIFTNKRVCVNGTSSDAVKQTGTGAFNYNKSRTFSFGKVQDVLPTDNDISKLEKLREKLEHINSLGEYQQVIDHRVRAADLTDLVLEDEGVRAANLAATITRNNDGSLKTEDIITVIGENPHIYPVDHGRLIILTPASLGPSVNRTLLTKELISSINTFTIWKNRAAMIYDVMERIEFSFYASPRGDLICEMPLYDFQPADFVLPTQRSDSPIAQDAYQAQLTVLKHDTISWQRSFSDEQVRTQMTTHFSLIDGYTETGGTSETIGEKTVTTLRTLIPQFGLRAETADVRAFISNAQAAQVYCEIKLNQWNSDARSARVEIVPRPSMVWPNRAMEFAERCYIATTRKITHSIVWGESGDMGMSLDVNYVRGWDGQTETINGLTKRLYSPLGGFASRPLNYAIEFGNTRPARSTQENK